VLNRVLSRGRGPKRITEYGVQRTEDGKIAVQKCKSERSSGGKVERWMTKQVGSGLRTDLAASKGRGVAG
jgi:hypothetical protein